MDQLKYNAMPVVISVYEVNLVLYNLEKHTTFVQVRSRGSHSHKLAPGLISVQVRIS